jgi:hypothetical protein
MVGSAGAPQLDLTFSATTNGAAGNVFLYASDTNFTLGSGTFVLNLGGTNSGGDGSVQGRAWGGTSNTEFQFSGANLLASIGPLDDRIVLRQRHRTVRGGLEPVLADDGRDDLPSDGGHEHRRPQPADLAGARAEHVGVDADGAGADRLRRAASPPPRLNRVSRRSRPASAGLVVCGARDAASAHDSCGVVTLR